MYEIFDRFMANDTWFKNHGSEDRDFLTVLYKVVWSDEFSPDQMRKYFRSKFTDDQLTHFNRAIDRYCNYAWAVKEFLRYNNVPRPSLRSGDHD
jgi:hypothetical protein